MQHAFVITNGIKDLSKAITLPTMGLKNSIHGLRSYTKIKFLKIERKKKNPGDIIILQMCPINDSHMMYGS